MDSGGRYFTVKVRFPTVPPSPVTFVVHVEDSMRMVDVLLRVLAEAESPGLSEYQDRVRNALAAATLSEAVKGRLECHHGEPRQFNMLAQNAVSLLNSVPGMAAVCFTFTPLRPEVCDLQSQEEQSKVN